MSPTPVPRAAGRRRLRMLLFILVIDAVLLGIAEIVSRFAAPVYFDEVVRAENLKKPKDPGEKRIFVYGESTIFGYPYGPRNSTAVWLQSILDEVLPSEKTHVVNFGKPARGSDHLYEALAETVHLQPDAVVLCLGHNEFLPRSLSFVQGDVHRWCYFNIHLYRTGYEGICKFKHGKDGGASPSYAGIPPWGELHASVMNHYRTNVGRMLALTQAKGIPTILCIPGCNLADMPPMRSMHEHPMADSEAKVYEQAVARLRQKLRRGELDEEALTEALTTSPRYADATYSKGRTLALQGKHAEAFDAFATARDLDGLPFRCKSEQIDALRELAAEYDVTLVDLPAVFRAASQGNAPGMNLFVDACHPRPKGQYLMAQAIANALQTQRQLAPMEQWDWKRLPSFDHCVTKANLTPEQWRAPERAGAWVQIDAAPEIAVELTRYRPVLAAENDLEWQAFHALALWRCGRTSECQQAWSKLSAQEKDQSETIVTNWTHKTQRYWKEMKKGIETKDVISKAP